MQGETLCPGVKNAKHNPKNHVERGYASLLRFSQRTSHKVTKCQQENEMRPEPRDYCPSLREPKRMEIAKSATKVRASHDEKDDQRLLVLSRV